MTTDPKKLAAADPQMLAAKLAAGQTALRAYLHTITVAGFNVGDRVTDEQVLDAVVVVVEAVDDVEANWPPKTP